MADWSADFNMHEKYHGYLCGQRSAVMSMYLQFNLHIKLRLHAGDAFDLAGKKKKKIPQLSSTLF